jgi:hypothetical protein
MAAEAASTVAAVGSTVAAVTVDTDKQESIQFLPTNGTAGKKSSRPFCFSLEEITQIL